MALKIVQTSCCKQERRLLAWRRFSSLKIIHVGQPTFTDNKGIWRPRQEALELLRNRISAGVIEINEDTMVALFEAVRL